MFFFQLVFFSPLFSNLNAIVTFVDLINIYPLCDNIFVSTYVMCDLSLKIHPLNFGNAYLKCFASEPCFQHYSGWSFLSFLLLLHFIPVALVQCPSHPFPIIFEACDTLIISTGLLISLSLLKSFWFSTLNLTNSSSDDLFCFSLKDSSFQHLQHLPLSMISKCSIPRGVVLFLNSWIEFFCLVLHVHALSSLIISCALVLIPLLLQSNMFWIIDCFCTNPLCFSILFDWYLFLWFCDSF